MAKNIYINRNEILYKNDYLAEVKANLKAEFVGLDSIIEQIVDSCNSWYLIPELQERPLIVNLWGLTGVGKTSLIKRFVELIKFEDKFYRLDMGQKSGFFKSINDLCKSKEDYPVIILLDEFQHAKTKNPYPPFEEESDNIRDIWELLDSGKISFINWMRSSWALEDDLIVLKGLVNHGVKVKNGRAIERLDVFKRIIGNGIFSETKDEDGFLNPNPNQLDETNPWFIPEATAVNIMSIALNKYNFHLIKDVYEYTSEMNEDEIISFIRTIINESYTPTIKDFSKSLIFVAGNLDDAFSIANNFNVDIDADEFHNQTLKITQLEIKEVLKTKFRSEQIARLGNNHIIYPALSSNSYKSIIEKEVKKIIDNYNDTFGINFEVNQNVLDLIYSEGVIPTQGVRPTLTTINLLFTSRLNNFLSQVFLNGERPSVLKLYIKDKMLCCDFMLFSKLLFTMEEKLVLTLDSLRENKKDELQAITAVHESGHIILMSFIEGKVPKFAFSKSASADSEGFVYNSKDKKYRSKQDIENYICTNLGGLVAERLIFGEDNATIGSSGDLESATHAVMYLLKNSGFSKVPINYAEIKSEYGPYSHNIEDVEREAEEIVLKALSKTEKILKQEKKLLLELSIYLFENTHIKQETIIEFINKYAVSKPNHISETFYRDKLKIQHGTSKTLALFDENSLTVLNKKS